MKEGQESVISDDSAKVPRQRMGIDITSLKLSTQEAYVFFQVDGRASTKQLGLLCGLNREELNKVLCKLSELNAIVWGEEGDSPQSCARDNPKSQNQAAKQLSKSTGESPSQGVQEQALKNSFEQMELQWKDFPFDEAALAEEVALSREQKKQILYLYQNLERFNHYQLLWVSPDACGQSVRKSYYKMAKVFHPDRHFRKDLGSYVERLDLIFKQLGIAYDTLSDPSRRQLYDDQLANPSHEVPQPGSFGGKGVNHQAEEAFKDGCRLYREGQVLAAHKRFLEAVSLDGHNSDYRAYFNQVDHIVRKAKADAALKKGRAQHQAGRTREACALYINAAETWPVAENLCRVADLLNGLGLERGRAVQYAKKAVALEPGNGNYAQCLARLSFSLGKDGQ